MGIDTLDELKKKQLSNVPKDYLLKESDLKRILKYVDTSIFDDNFCCLWKGYVTNNKGLYVNFYFNKKKMALHRLLYINFIGQLYSNSYLEFTCPNKGVCCNINHIKIKKKKLNIKKEKNSTINNTVYFD